MNTTEIERNWNNQNGDLKQKYATPTHNGLMQHEIRFEKMYGALQIKPGKSTNELHKIIVSI